VSVAENTGVAPETGMLLTSRSVMVIVETDTPSATTGVVPLIVECAASGTPGFTVIDAAPLLDMWAESPGNGAVTEIVPTALPVKLTVHVALLPFPLSVQLALDGETPAPLAVTLSVPAGVTDPDAVSFTVTVQLLA
jgi:hypothetical protein